MENRDGQVNTRDSLPHLPQMLAKLLDCSKQQNNKYMNSTNKQGGRELPVGKFSCLLIDVPDTICVGVTRSVMCKAIIYSSKFAKNLLSNTIYLVLLLRRSRDNSSFPRNM
jgi:hypothetical protein